MLLLSTQYMPLRSAMSLIRLSIRPCTAARTVSSLVVSAPASLLLASAMSLLRCFSHSTSAFGGTRSKFISASRLFSTARRYCLCSSSFSASAFLTSSTSCSTDSVSTLMLPSTLFIDWRTFTRMRSSQISFWSEYMLLRRSVSATFSSSSTGLSFFCTSAARSSLPPYFRSNSTRCCGDIVSKNFSTVGSLSPLFCT